MGNVPPPAPPDEVYEEDLRRFRRRIRWMEAMVRALLIGASAALAAMAVLTVVAWVHGG